MELYVAVPRQRLSDAERERRLRFAVDAFSVEVVGLGYPLDHILDAGHVPQSDLSTEACLYQIELAAHRHFGGELSAVSLDLKTFLDRNIRIDKCAPRNP